jgi:hypothetical protein
MDEAQIYATLRGAGLKHWCQNGTSADASIRWGDYGNGVHRLA